jgi:tRNA A-37 threonylcarbamoyl transferase component Bud32
MFNEKYKIPEEILKSNPRVFGYEVDGENVYVKKREKNKKHIGHIFQELIYKITKNPMLIPTVLSKNENEVLFESEKIMKLKNEGVNVPDILYSCEDYFVMSDTGESLKEHMKAHIAEKDYYIERAIEELSKLHYRNYAHGGSQIRNFTIKNEKISLIDFEEKIPEKYIDSFKIRDLLVFILSLQKANFDPDINKICEIYEEKTSLKVYEDLKKFLLKYRWIYFLKSKIFSKIRMKDVRDFIAVIEKVDKK